MEDVVRRVKGIVGGVTEVLIAAIGLLVVAQVVFGSGIYDVVGNITALVDMFIGASASLASVIALMIVVGVLSRN
jgi:hypothetical protein